MNAHAGAAAQAPAPAPANAYTDNVLTIKTVQIAPFRTLMTALKDILLETNITFKKDGIRIVNMDKSHTMLAHLFLSAENFEHYECHMDKIIIGVNMFHLFKLINSIDNDDTLTLYIEKKDYNDGIVSFLGLKFENGDIKQCKTQKLRLIEPEPEEYLEPNVVLFSSVINLPSSDFQKIIRDMSCISEKLEIKSVGNELIFRCSGQFATAEIRRVETDGSMEFIQKQDCNKITQGEFSLKNLGYFIKCTNLCSQIEMYLENDRPLVVKYYVASLGEIKLCLAPLPSSN
jgi:proliferating cell nuclear antigen